MEFLRYARRELFTPSLALCERRAWGSPILLVATAPVPDLAGLRPHGHGTGAPLRWEDEPRGDVAGAEDF
jgi:hypothetical protein